MMKKLLYGALAFAPLVASAQALNTVNTNIIVPISHAINLLIPVAFGLAILFFFYGVARYILSAGDPKNAAAGKSIMIYGVIAIAVMASVWGLVIYLQNTLGVSNTTSVPTPTVQGLQ
jgi:hypothetical protein